MENSESIYTTSDTGRKIVAAIVGIILIILLILVAKWTGDQIRAKLAKPAPVPTAITQPAPIATNSLLGDNTQNTATYSAIPSTGPNDWLYAVAGIMALAGIGARKFAGKIL